MMTKTIEQEALDLINEVRAEFRLPRDVRLYRNTVPVHEALCRVIEQLRAEREAHAATKTEFEAFRREVSDMLQVMGFKPGDARIVGRFITAKPDPVVEALGAAGLVDPDWLLAPRAAADLRAALAKRGLKLVEAGDA